MDSGTRKTLETVAARLSVPPEWLYNLIKAESAWNPQAWAKMPYNAAQIARNPGTLPQYAKGLIQFTDSTARSLGYKNALDIVTRYPTTETQLLTPVYAYLKQFEPFRGKQDFYLSVFYPAARFWSPAQRFPDDVLISNPGIKTPADYIALVEGKSIKNAVPFLGLLAAGAAFAYFFGKRTK